MVVLLCLNLTPGYGPVMVNIECSSNTVFRNVYHIEKLYLTLRVGDCSNREFYHTSVFNVVHYSVVNTSVTLTIV